MAGKPRIMRTITCPAPLWLFRLSSIWMVPACLWRMAHAYAAHTTNNPACLCVNTMDNPSMPVPAAFRIPLCRYLHSGGAHGGREPGLCITRSPDDLFAFLLRLPVLPSCHLCDTHATGPREGTPAPSKVSHAISMSLPSSFSFSF